ncbi:2-amino-4-oxopentanoate thiolase subunit OrtB [Roseovarius sp. EGI FJ00037]|uniref:2-amino-4-oxopentanoate thiolase subunit OrtB n=1 Tax=Roseovarius salincola TaxID=2978479 RepID=UPI0022A88C96|nr:2-amino-4-oxopentanoate thiolase subunit OrtB [Roseovarius sp. EGI FJ00037]MCZ0812205.1 2-amino-4-oxopentanoate thiolase subunit OrtB [Roseovarius sp. EGI FJ00037]
MTKTDYASVMARKGDIMLSSLGIDYAPFMAHPAMFDYEALMGLVPYDIDQVRQVQSRAGVGSTALIELRQITRLARKLAPKGKGARIFVKDEAANPSGSYKARRAALSLHHAEHAGFKGVVTATSGNYGAAVASQAARRNLACVVVQEVYDSHGIGQPEILEKGRACEIYGAEVAQLSVGPELFYSFLRVLEDTGYFNASLYTPFAIAGVEPLGFEIVEQMRDATGTTPDVVICTHAGGGNLTGTARGLRKAGADHTQIIGASVDLTGLHMASDTDFNRKHFTTGHTGFGIPFAGWPDRTDVPRNAARVLRYMDRYLLLKQGEVFYMTEALARLEGLERGPAGNISLAAAFALSQEMDADQTIVVQETEYAGAGKQPSAQLDFARRRGIDILRGDSESEIPGQNVIIPDDPRRIRVRDVDMTKLRRSLVKKVVAMSEPGTCGDDLVSFLAEETQMPRADVAALI